MRADKIRTRWFLAGLLIVAWAMLTGCERPDPQESLALSPTAPPTPLPSATAGPTQAPVQVYVVVVQPTAAISPSPSTQLQIAAPTAAAPTALPTETPPGTVAPTAIPEGYYLGWAWTESLEVERDQAAVDQYGLLLRDRPSREGREVGIVMGYANLAVVGQARCGYTPVLVHEYSLLSKTSPHPEIATALPLPTEAPPFAPTPFPDRSSIITGWAYTDELTVLGQTAISGPLGVNLRSDPCLAATNLGFIPAGSNMIVTGWPSGDYTPVRIEQEVVQAPLESFLLLGDDLLGGSAPGEPAAASPIVTPAATATPTATVTLTPTVSLTPTLTFAPTPTATP